MNAWVKNILLKLLSIFFFFNDTLCHQLQHNKLKITNSLIIFDNFKLIQIFIFYKLSRFSVNKIFLLFSYLPWFF